MCFLIIRKQDFEHDSMSFLLSEVSAKRLVLNLWTDFSNTGGAHVLTVAIQNIGAPFSLLKVTLNTPVQNMLPSN